MRERNKKKHEWADASHTILLLKGLLNRPATWWETSKIVPGPPHPHKTKMMMSERRKTRRSEVLLVIPKASSLKKKDTSISLEVAS